MNGGRQRQASQHVPFLSALACPGTHQLAQHGLSAGLAHADNRRLSAETLIINNTEYRLLFQLPATDSGCGS